MSDPKPIGPSVRAVPDGDNRERLICADCGFVQYDNPKIVVGAVPLWQGRVLLCKRAIEPRVGYWTLPAGYLELGETPEAGAVREAQEEAQADIAIDTLLAVYSVPRISQVQLIYRARLKSPEFAPGPESLDVRLFDWSEIPWDALAFPTVRWALDAWREVGDAAAFAVRANPPASNPA
jgi:ADP-ribose pyrophosphatase YjhB (NUDIX family)